MSQQVRFYANRFLADLFNKKIVEDTVTTWSVTRADHSEVAERVWHFGTAEEFVFERPTSTDTLPAEIERKIGTIRISRPFVSEFLDVSMAGKEGIPFVNNRPILENSIGPRYQLPLNFVKHLHSKTTSSRSSKEEIDTAVSFVGPWARGYYHWFSDYLLRLDGLRRYETAFGIEPTVIIPQNPPTWAKDSLRAAGIPESRWKQWDGEQTRINRLIVPSLRRETPITAGKKGYTFSPSAYRWLAEEIKETIEPDSTRRRRIFISRQKADSRRIENRREVMQELSERGFEKYILEDMTFEEQVDLFNNSDCIVAAQGAGLTNMIYATETTVVTLFGKDINSCYPVLADGLGFDNAVQMCTASGLDLRVDTDKLAHLLNTLAIE